MATLTHFPAKLRTFLRGTHDALVLHDVRDLASEAEARGFSSLYVPEHTHIPSSQATPVPMGGDLPVDVYPRSLDPMAALTAAAAVTSTMYHGGPDAFWRRVFAAMWWCT